MAMPKLSSAAIEAQLARILASPQFRDSPRLQTFLRFVVSLTLEQKTEQIKESTIASEVFGRLDTSDDSIVRSAARRLRGRLEEYYEQTGAGDPVRIVIPKGSYVPEIQEQLPLAPSEPLSVGSKSDRSGRKLRWTLTVAAALTMFAAVTLIALPWHDYAWTNQRVNPEAQELYLKGRYYWSKRTPDDLTRAVDRFTQAIVKDPRYADAYVGLADSYNLLSEYTTMPYREAFKRATAAAKTAIELDDSLPEAHNSLAFASFYGNWDPETAEREFKRALQLNPNYVTAHHWYATFLMSIGREREALAEIDRAQTLDPSSNAILADKGVILLHSGQIAAARVLLEELAANDPQFLSPHQYLASVYLLEKRYSDYLSELRKIAELSKDTTELAIVEAGEKGFSYGGATTMLDRMIRVQESSSVGQDVRYYRLAQMCGLLGNRSKAIAYLKLALDRRDVNMLVLTIDEPFAAMRNDPAFQELVKRVGVVRRFA